MSKRLTVANRDQCVGCFSCMYACSRTFRRAGSTNKAALRVRVYSGVEGAFSLRTCLRCAEPDCAAACPTGALVVQPQGGVRLEKERCISCGACVRACVLKALQWDEEERIPLPCVHCGTCARFCPNNVLTLTEEA